MSTKASKNQGWDFNISFFEAYDAIVGFVFQAMKIEDMGESNAKDGKFLVEVKRWRFVDVECINIWGQDMCWERVPKQLRTMEIEPFLFFLNDDLLI